MPGGEEPHEVTVVGVAPRSNLLVLRPGANTYGSALAVLALIPFVLGPVRRYIAPLSLHKLFYLEM